MFGFDFSFIIMEMTSMDCNICGERSWHFFKSYDEVVKSECLLCRSTLHTMNNKKTMEANIEKIQKEQI